MSHTVLICDDSVFMRTMVGDILTQAGHVIVGEAETGVEAVERYRQLRPDFVTMDVVMPEMGGIDAVRQIMAFEPSAKIVMCSAMGQQPLGDQPLQEGQKVQDGNVQSTSENMEVSAGEKGNEIG